MPNVNDLTLYSLMTNTKAARIAISKNQITDANFCLASIYQIAKFAACPSIAARATEEALRIHTDIMSVNANLPLMRFPADRCDIRLFSADPEISSQKITFN